MFVGPYTAPVAAGTKIVAGTGIAAGVGIGAVAGAGIILFPSSTAGPEDDMLPNTATKGKCDDDKETCDSKFPGLIKCNSLPCSYRYDSDTAALNALRKTMGINNLKIVSKNNASSGPCAGQGWHYGVKGGGRYIASLLGCPCCEDTPAGPILKKRWRIH